MPPACVQTDWLAPTRLPPCVQSFAEKPKTAEALDAMRVDTTVLGGCGLAERCGLTVKVWVNIGIRGSWRPCAPCWVRGAVWVTDARTPGVGLQANAQLLEALRLSTSVLGVGGLRCGPGLGRCAGMRLHARQLYAMRV